MSLIKNVNGVPHKLEFICVETGHWTAHSVEVYACVAPTGVQVGFVGIPRQSNRPVSDSKMGPLCVDIQSAAIRADICQRHGR